LNGLISVGVELLVSISGNERVRDLKIRRLLHSLLLDLDRHGGNPTSLYGSGIGLVAENFGALESFSLDTRRFSTLRDTRHNLDLELI